jgi:CBS domain-containing membrane protein
VRDWRFAFVPVCLDSLLLVLAGTIYNRSTGKAYPHAAIPVRPAPAGRFTDADIDRVLGRWNQVLDVPRDELHALLEAAEAEAYRRRVDMLSCSDVMSRDVAAVEYGTPLDEAWTLLRRRGVKALPVVDRWRHVVGVVTLADFLRGAGLDQHEGVGSRLRKLLKPTTGLTSDKPEVVGQLMTRRVQVVSANASLAALVPVFSVTGHHHLPVVDEKLKLVGIITQTDLVRALQRQG